MKIHTSITILLLAFVLLLLTGCSTMVCYLPGHEVKGKNFNITFSDMGDYYFAFTVERSNPDYEIEFVIDGMPSVYDDEGRAYDIPKNYSEIYFDDVLSDTNILPSKENVVVKVVFDEAYEDYWNKLYDSYLNTLANSSSALYTFTVMGVCFML